jgi:alkyl hydroperoxide reductase subunit AhpF
MNHRLEAYVSEDCYGCGEAREIARELSVRFPDLRVEVIDVDASGIERPPAVFAVPSFLLNDELLWLGNPRREDAVQQIANFLQEAQET